MNILKIRPIQLLTLSTLILGHNVVFAKTFHTSEKLSLAMEYESNPRMVEGGPGVTRLRAIPSLKFAYDKGLNEFMGNISADAVRSSDQAVSINRTNPHASVSWAHQMINGSFKMTGAYEQDSTRTTEFLDTGNISTDSTRTRKAVTADWQSTLSERSTLSLQLEHDQNTYNSSSFVNYTQSTGNLKYQYALSEKMKPYASLSLTHFSSAANPSQDQQAGQIGLEWQYSETLDLSLYAGAENVSGSGNNKGGIVGATARQSGSRTKWKLSYDHTVSPSAIGYFVKSDQVLGSWAYLLSERKKVGVDLSFRKNEDVYKAKASQIGAWFTDELTQNWSSKVYFYHKRYSQSGKSAGSNMIGVSVIYASLGY